MGKESLDEYSARGEVKDDHAHRGKPHRMARSRHNLMRPPEPRVASNDARWGFVAQGLDPMAMARSGYFQPGKGESLGCTLRAG